MRKSVKQSAEDQLLASQKQAKLVLKEKEKARQERTERVARQRVLRQEKEAIDRKMAAAAAKVASKPKKTSRPQSGSTPI